MSHYQTVALLLLLLAGALSAKKIDGVSSLPFTPHSVIVWRLNQLFPKKVPPNFHKNRNPSRDGPRWRWFLRATACRSEYIVATYRKHPIIIHSSELRCDATGWCWWECEKEGGREREWRCRDLADDTAPHTSPGIERSLFSLACEEVSCSSSPRLFL